MSVEIKAPNDYSKFLQAPEGLHFEKIFLAGSIEMGLADNWQSKVVESLSRPRPSKNSEVFVFLNPRRDDWDSSWEQTITNPNFKQQVEWELQGLEDADTILFYFDPLTKSPISLLELGLYAQSKKVIVCCPYGFWRRGNVEVVCHRYDIPLVDSLDDLTELVYQASLI